MIFFCTGTGIYGKAGVKNGWRFRWMLARTQKVVKPHQLMLGFLIQQKPRFSSCIVDVLTLASLLRSCLPYTLKESKLTQWHNFYHYIQFYKHTEDWKCNENCSLYYIWVFDQWEKMLSMHAFEVKVPFTIQTSMS